MHDYLKKKAMEHVIDFQGRPIELKVTLAAQQALVKCHHPIPVEIEHYFSYLLHKGVRFGETSREDAIAVND